MKDFGLYVVMTDPVVGYARCAEAAVKAGVKMLQLRMKRVPRGEMLREAREVREITRGSGTVFIVNDSPEIAAQAGADGVHVGQEDISPGEIRSKFPELPIIGLSTHNPAQVAAAGNEPVDYIGVGPVYSTPTKEIPDPTVGLENMGRMIGMSAHPAVAIGGIDASRLHEVAKAGARNVAVVRAVCQSPNPYEAIVRLKETLTGICRA
jgi:thiamine-phosphate pyrophosphorylase